MARNCPGLDKAISYMRNHAAAFPDSRLPSVRETSRACSLSIRTVTKALKALVIAGEVNSRHGKCTWPSGASEPLPDSRPKVDRSKWTRSLVRFEHDIASGAFPPGVNLPQRKQLCSRYDVSIGPLRKMLISLEKRGVLVRSGTSIRPLVKSHGTKSTQKCIVYITGTFIEPLWHETAYVYRNLSAECIRAGVKMVAVQYNDARPDLPGRYFYNRKEIAEPELQGEVIGYVVAPLRIRQPDLLVSQVLSYKKPVSLWAEGFFDDKWSNGKRHFFGLARGRTPLRLFSNISQPEPGRRMARLLMRLGHKKIAYLSPYHGSTWSQERLRGLRDEFARHGLPDAVVAFTDEVHFNNWSFVAPLKTRYKKDSFLDTTRLHSVLCQELHKYISLRSDYVYDLLAINEMLNLLRPFFDRAIAIPEITAFVGASDYVALIALDWLLAKGIEVPDCMSVAGFDDLMESLVRGLTSYNMNSAGLCAAMVRHILYPKDPLFANRNQAFVAEGDVVERASTGPVRR